MLKKKYEAVRAKVEHQAHLVFKKFKQSNSRELTNQDVQLMLAEYATTFLQVLRPEEVDKLHTLMARLNEEQMMVINMKFWKGMTEREMATELNRSPSWVHRKLHEALSAMRA